MPKLEITKDLALSMTASLPIGLCLAAHSGEIVYANSKAEDIFGFNKEELAGHFVEDLVAEGSRHAHRALRENFVAKPISTAMSGGRLLSGIKKDGTEVFLQIGLTPLNHKYILVTFIESTNEIIKPSNSNDPLSGLPNRKLFDEYVKKLRTLAIRNQKNISIAFIDLDNFKPINDQYGHHIGDMVICEVADMLRSCLRQSDIIARIGGDEFILCLYDVSESTHLQQLLAQLIQLISSLTNVAGCPISISASVGAIMTYTPENIEICEMISMADKLMYEIKKENKGTLIVKEIAA